MPATFPGDARWEAYAREADANLEVRFPAKAGRRVVGVSFVRRSSCEPRRRASAASGRKQPRAERADRQPGRVWRSVTIGGPFVVAGSGDSASRRRIFVCRPTAASQEDACAQKILDDARASRLSAAGAPTDVGDAARLLPGRPRARASFEAGIQLALERLLVQPRIPVPHRARSSRRRPGDRLPAQRPRAGVAAVVLPLEQHPGRRAARSGRARAAEGSGGARAAGAADAGRSAVDGARRELRRAVARRPQRPRGGARSGPVSRSSTRTCARRSSARRSSSSRVSSRGPERARAADRRLHVPQRAARPALRDPDVYGSHFRRVTLADRAARGLLGQGSILTVTSYPNRTSPVLRGKWLLENLLGAPPPPPPPNVPAAEGHAVRTASPRRCASGWSSIARIRSARAATRRWIRSGSRSRTSTPIGNGAPSTRRQADRCVGCAPGRHEVRRAGGAPAGRCSASARSSSRTVTEKLLTYALGRGLEYYDAPGGSRDLPRGRRRRLPLVVDRARHRQEHAVSDDGGQQSHDHHQEGHSAPDRAARPRRDAGAAAARRHGAGVRALQRTAAASPVRRLGVVYVPNGMAMDQWTPATGERRSREFEFSPILKAAGAVSRSAAS